MSTVGNIRAASVTVACIDGKRLASLSVGCSVLVHRSKQGHSKCITACATYVRVFMSQSV